MTHVPDQSRQWSFPTAIIDFFGKKPGQTTAEFAAEMKHLTETDRAEFRAELSKLGYRLG